MPRRKGRRNKSNEKNSSAGWTIQKNDDQKQKVFDPSSASVRKNKEYLELKRDIALKGIKCDKICGGGVNVNIQLIV